MLFMHEMREWRLIVGIFIIIMEFVSYEKSLSPLCRGKKLTWDFPAILHPVIHVSAADSIPVSCLIYQTTGRILFSWRGSQNWKQDRSCCEADFASRCLMQMHQMHKLIMQMCLPSQWCIFFFRNLLSWSNSAVIRDVGHLFCNLRFFIIHKKAWTA